MGEGVNRTPKETEPKFDILCLFYFVSGLLNQINQTSGNQGGINTPPPPPPLQSEFLDQINIDSPCFSHFFLFKLPKAYFLTLRGKINSRASVPSLYPCLDLHYIQYSNISGIGECVAVLSALGKWGQMSPLLAYLLY